MSIDTDRDRLSQTQMLKWLQHDLQVTDMITVYLSDSRGPHNYHIYCALIPSDQIERALSSPDWNLIHGQGIPAAVVYYEGGKKRVGVALKLTPRWFGAKPPF